MRVFADRDKIRAILTSPDIWDLIRNDREIDSSTFVLPEDWLYLTDTGNEVFILSGSGHIHANIMPETRPNAYFMCIRFIDWIRRHTDLDEIYLNIHKKHKNAIKLGLLCGFTLLDIKNDRHSMLKRLKK